MKEAVLNQEDNPQGVCSQAKLHFIPTINSFIAFGGQGVTRLTFGALASNFIGS